jgi:hypothetical protein
VSVAGSPPSGGGAAAAAPTPAGEACPLCGAPLDPEQEWCLHCGAAARTRLAPSPNWKGLLATLAVVVALSLGVLAAALVKLAGNAESTPTTTRTVTVAAVLTTPTAQSAILPGAGASATSATQTSAPATGTSTATTATGSTGIGAPKGGKARAKSKLGGLGLGRKFEETLRKHIAGSR